MASVNMGDVAKARLSCGFPHENLSSGVHSRQRNDRASSPPEHGCISETVVLILKCIRPPI